MISIEHLSKEFSSKPILEDISFLINRKDRIALVGKNGAGKTTLLRLIAGEYTPTRGTISYDKNISIGYLPQQMQHAEGTTVREEARKAFQHILEIENQIERLTRQLSEREDYESAEYQLLIDQLTHNNELLQLLGGQNFDGEMERTLLGLGFERKDFDRLCSEFSGGWRMRIELAKILLKRPDVFLLDEPTNHLDIESIQWLEQFLIQSGSTIVLVSHDRAFIDNVTNRTIEISLGHIYDYAVNYSHYIELRKERREQQQRAYENQQKMIQETEDFIERFRYKATKAVQVQSRIKQLEKIERIEIDQEDTSRLRLHFPPAPRSGDYPIMIEGLSKSFDSHTVFSNVNLTLKRGDKVAFVGKNGEGKTTLVRCLMGQIPYEGKLKIGHNVKIGYFAQNQASLLDGELTVFDTIDRVAVGEVRTKIRDILGAFMFGGEASEKKVKVLSGGERSRLAMIRLLLEPVNLLILDEPTNHLDMQSKDVLKEALIKFDGTLIVVSHDRYFLDGLVDKVYEFGGGKVQEHIGNIYDFLHKKQIDSLQELEHKSAPAAADKMVPQESIGKQDYEQQKEKARLQRKIEKQIKETEDAITQLEDAQKQMENLFAADSTTQTPENMQRYQSLLHQIEQKMYEWELLQDEIAKQ